MSFNEYSLFGRDGIHLSRRGRRIFARRLADLLSESRFKLTNLGGSVQSCDICISISNRVDECTYQSSEECSPTLSKGKNPKSSHLRCIYTNARSLANKWEELELHAQSESYDVIGITETWWENLHDWKTTMDGYKLFRKDRKGRRGGAVALYVKEKSECMEAS